MPQFAVYKNRNEATRGRFPLLLDVQSDLLEPLDTRVVVPLSPAVTARARGTLLIRHGSGSEKKRPSWTGCDPCRPVRWFICKNITMSNSPSRRTPSTLERAAPALRRRGGRVRRVGEQERTQRREAHPAPQQRSRAFDRARLFQQVEQALRGSEALRRLLRAVMQDRDRGEHSIGAIWRRERLTCPTREQLGSYLLQVLDDNTQDYIDFHLKAITCPFCLAMFDEGIASQQLNDKMSVDDVAVYVARALKD